MFALNIELSFITIPVKYKVGCSCISSVQKLRWIPVRTCCTKIKVLKNQRVVLFRNKGPRITRIICPSRPLSVQVRTYGARKRRTGNVGHAIFILNPKWRETVKTILINYQD